MLFLSSLLENHWRTTILICQMLLKIQSRERNYLLNWQRLRPRISAGPISPTRTLGSPSPSVQM